MAWFQRPGCPDRPPYRRQGTGKAVVSALCQRLLDGPRVVLYRYSVDNLASAGIAHSLALTPVGVAVSVRPGGRG
jgi:predicted GNAT family acetyltransferase